MVATKHVSVLTIPLLLAASSAVAGSQGWDGLVSRSELDNNQGVDLRLRLDNQDEASSLALEARAKLQKSPPAPKADKSKSAQSKPAKLQKKPPQEVKPKIDKSKISGPKLQSSTHPIATKLKSATQYHVPSYKGPGGKTVKDPQGWKYAKRSQLQRRAKLQKKPPAPKAEKQKTAEPKRKPAKLQKKPPQEVKPKIDKSKISGPKLISSTHPIATKLKAATQYHVPSYKGPGGKTVKDPQGWKYAKRSMQRRRSRLQR